MNIDIDIVSSSPLRKFSLMSFNILNLLMDFFFAFLLSLFLLFWAKFSFACRANKFLLENLKFLFVFRRVVIIMLNSCHKKVQLQYLVHLHKLHKSKKKIIVAAHILWQTAVCPENFHFHYFVMIYFFIPSLSLLLVGSHHEILMWNLSWSKISIFLTVEV